MKRCCLNPGLWEDGGRIFILLSNGKIQGIYGSVQQIKKELANHLKRCPLSQNAYQSPETRFDPPGKVCRKD